MKPTRKSRRGATVVETALVLTVFALLLFGAFEYCRFLYVLHVTNNAARDGSRYAVVNVDKPSTFDSVDYTDGAGVTYPSIQNFTTARMGGTQKQLDGYQVAVFAVDAAGQSLSPPVVRPKTTSTGSPKVYPDPFDPADPYRVPWNQATFGEGIGVTIRGTYTPLLASFLLMPSSVPVVVTGVTASEG
jgi:Flp pilus assembly protein TadG